MFREIIFIAAGSSNGRTPGFGPGYLGSSPSPAAMSRIRNTSFVSLTQSKDRALGFGPRYLGSSPSPAARDCTPSLGDFA